MSARAEVLSRIRTAIGAQAGNEGASAAAGDDGRSAGSAGEVPRGYRLHREVDHGELLDLLADRLADYRATVRRTTPGQLAAALGAALAQRGARCVVVPPGLDLPKLPTGVEAVADAEFTASELDTFDGAVTAAAVAIAETGTIILDGSPDQGRRTITLLPDYLPCASCARARSSPWCRKRSCGCARIGR